ncbi:MAG: universal stress protein [Chloroflexota bacterium]|nr:universal stress protein [Chloroflexota bacterium]
MQKRRVLIPLDGSEFRRQILPHVRRLLGPDSHELVLLRVTQHWEGAIGDPLWTATVGLEMPIYISEWMPAGGAVRTRSASWQEVQTALEKELEPDLEELQAAGYEVGVVIQRADLVEGITRVVESSEIDMIAMATHCRGTLGKLVLGSVAEEVLRRLSVPVLLVHPMPSSKEVPTLGEALVQHATQQQPLRLALVVDSSPTARPAAILAGELARALDAPLSLLVALRENEGVERCVTVMEEIAEAVGVLEPAPKCEPLVGLSDEVLLRSLRETHFDLVIVGPFRHPGESDPYTIGAVAHRIVQRAPSSTLMVKGLNPDFRTVLACIAPDDKEVVESAARFARATNATLRVLHVVPPSASGLRQTEGDSIPLEEVLDRPTSLTTFFHETLRTLEEAGFDRDAVTLMRGNIGETILREARSSHIDLLVMGCPSRTSHFTGSVTDYILRHAHQSVLVVREAE